MEDGWKKYRMMLYAGANMEYTDSKGNIRVIETEPVLLDVFDEAIDPYILGKTPSLGSFRITEGEETLELIQNFNDNMKHVKIWSAHKNRYISIAENEGFGARIYLVQNKMRYFLICYIINLRRNSLCQVKETITQSSLSRML